MPKTLSGCGHRLSSGEAVSDVQQAGREMESTGAKRRRFIVLPVYPAGMVVEPFVEHLAVALRKSMDQRSSARADFQEGFTKSCHQGGVDWQSEAGGLRPGPISKGTGTRATSGSWARARMLLGSARSSSMVHDFSKELPPISSCIARALTARQRSSSSSRRSRRKPGLSSRGKASRNSTGIPHFIFARCIGRKRRTLGSGA